MDGESVTRSTSELTPLPARSFQCNLPNAASHRKATDPVSGADPLHRRALARGLERGPFDIGSTPSAALSFPYGNCRAERGAVFPLWQLSGCKW